MDAFLIWFFGAVCGVTAGFVCAALMRVGAEADEVETFEHWRGER